MFPRKELIHSGTVWDLDVINQITYQGVPFVPGGSATDELVKVTAADTTAGYLGAKIAAGSGIQLTTTNPGGNETLTIACNVVDLDVKVAVSANDTTAGFLNGKLVAGTGITFTENNDGGNETLTVTLGSHTHAASDITSGVLGTGRLASTGTASSSTYLRGDQAWSGLDAGHITAGTVATARLGTGTASSSTYLKGDQTYAGLDAGHITAGTVPTARLATGTANSTTYLRGDQTWATITSGITGFSSQIGTAAPNATTNVSQLLVAVSTANGDIVLQAKGNGAVLAQIPDSTFTAGNKRGTYAVDFQRERSNATEVASGSYSAIVNGFRNSATSNYAFVGSGSLNSAIGSNSFIGSGNSNNASGSHSVVTGGNSNTASSTAATVGGGQNNQATNTSAVVAGGQSNQATGAYATVGGGFSNQNLAFASTICGGYQNYVYNNYGVVIGGITNTSLNVHSVVLGGEGNQSNHQYSTTVGGRYAKTLTSGSWAYSNHYNWSIGDSQFVDVLWTTRTSNNTPTVVTIMGGLDQGVSIPNFSIATFQIQVAARQLFTTNIASWIITGAVANVSGTITLYNVSTNIIHRSIGTWNATVVADNANQTLNFQVTGDNGNNIQWVANGRFTYCILNG